MLGGWLRSVDLVWQPHRFGFTNRVTKPRQFIGRQVTLASLLRILFDAASRIEPERQNLAFAGERIEATDNLQHAICLIGPVPHFRVELGKVEGRDLFGLAAPQLGEHDLFEKASVMCSRCPLPLRLDMLGKENLGYLPEC